MEKRLEFATGRKLDAIALGRIGIDMNPVEYNRPLEKTEHFRRSVGGSPANIAVAISRYGLKAGFIGRVADDPFGRYIFSYFEETGIDTGGLAVDKKERKTGLAFVEIKSPDNSGIVMYRADAVDLALSMEDIDEAYIADAKALVVSGTALAASPSREAVFYALKLARKHSTAVFFDIDYRPYTWQSIEEASLYCSMAAGLSDAIIGTREEFDVLERVDLPGNSDDAVSSAYWLAQKPSLVIIKHGKKGSTAYLANGEVQQGPVFPVKALKSQGAGDSYAGGVISALVKGKSILEAMRYGAGAAAIVVQRNSCSEAMPTEEEIHEFIDAYERKEI